MRSCSEHWPRTPADRYRSCREFAEQLLAAFGLLTEADRRRAWAAPAGASVVAAPAPAASPPASSAAPAASQPTAAPAANARLPVRLHQPDCAGAAGARRPACLRPAICVHPATYRDPGTYLCPAAWIRPAAVRLWAGAWLRSAAAVWPAICVWARRRRPPGRGHRPPSPRPSGAAGCWPPGGPCADGWPRHSGPSASRPRAAPTPPGPGAVGPPGFPDTGTYVPRPRNQSLDVPPQALVPLRP